MGTLLLSVIGWMFLLRLTVMFSPGYYGQIERVQNTKIAIDVFFNNPVLGSGIGSFADLSGVFEGIERMKYPHNILLEIASEMGSAGLLFFCTMLFFAFKKLFFLTKKYRNTPYHHLPNAVLAFLIFVFLTSLTGGNIDNPLLFAWIGISFILEPIIRKCSVEKPSTIQQDK